MAIAVYEVDIGWIPDTTYVNSYDDPEYLAFKLGFNEKLGKEIWAVYQVDSGATQLITDILPASYTALSVSEETNKYGYTRSFLPNQSIAKVEAYIDEVVTYYSV